MCPCKNKTQAHHQLMSARKKNTIFLMHILLVLKEANRSISLKGAQEFGIDTYTKCSFSLSPPPTQNNKYYALSHSLSLSMADNIKNKSALPLTLCQISAFMADSLSLPFPLHAPSMWLAGPPNPQTN